MPEVETEGITEGLWDPLGSGKREPCCTFQVRGAEGSLWVPGGCGIQARGTEEPFLLAPSSLSPCPWAGLLPSHFA